MRNMIQESRRILCSLLVVLLVLSLTNTFCVSVRAEKLDYIFEDAQVGSRKTSVYVLVEKLYNVTSFDVEIDVAENTGDQCKDWEVWVRSSQDGSFEKVDNVFLKERGGKVSKTIYLLSPRDVDAIAVFPGTLGSYQITMAISFSNPTFAPASGSAPGERPGTTDGDSPRILSGDWEYIRNDNAVYHAYVLKEKLCDVKSFDLKLQVNMKGEVHCKNWDVWARSSESDSFEKIGFVFMEDGTEEVTRTILLPEEMDIDAVFVEPDVDGYFSCTVNLTLFNPCYLDSTVVMRSSTLLDGYWKKDTICGANRTYNTSVFFLDEPVSCRQFDLQVFIDMKANTSCERWNVYVRSDGIYYQEEDLFLPNGTGDTEQTIHLSEVRNVDAVAVLPTARGNFSWTIAIGISNPE